MLFHQDQAFQLKNWWITAFDQELSLFCPKRPDAKLVLKMLFDMKKLFNPSTIFLGAACCTMLLAIYGFQTFHEDNIQYKASDSPTTIEQKPDTAYLTLDSKAILQQLTSSAKGEKINFKLCADKATCWEFELKETKIIADGATFTVNHNGKQTTMPIKGFHTFNGILKGNERNKAIFVLSANQIRGKFYVNGQSYTLEPLAGNKSVHRLLAHQIPTHASTGNEKAGPPAQCFNCPGAPCPSCYTGGNTNACHDVVNNNGAVCETEPLYLGSGLPSTSNYPMVELAIDVDYEFYVEFSSGTPYPTYPSLDEGVFLEVLQVLSPVQDTYSGYFGAKIVLVHLNIWTTDDNYNNSTAETLLASISNFWSNNKACIHRDITHLFSGAPFVEGNGASNNFNVCNEFGYAPYGYSKHNSRSQFERAFTVAHELGHSLGTGHTDNGMCCQLCSGDNILPNVVMCSDGLTVDNGNLVWAETSQFQVKEFLYGSTAESCLIDSTTSFEAICDDCYPETVPQITIQSDNPHPLPNCGDNDIINFTFEICNICDETVNWELDARFTTNWMAVEDLGDFVGTQSTPPFTDILGSEFSYAPNQCRTFHFTGRVIAVPNLGIIKVTPFINGEAYTDDALTIPILDYSNQIGGTNEQSLDHLINIGKMAPDGCLPCGTAGCKTKTVVQRLVIDKPDYCMDGYNLKFNPGAEIVVESGNHLTIRNSRLFACTNMWAGITVEDGASLTLEGCKIEDAMFGVQTLGTGTLSISGNQFLRNFVGIYAGGPTPYNGPGPNFAALMGNTFDGSGGLLPTYPGQTPGLALSLGTTSFAGLWVQTKAGPISSLKNTFLNLSNGIYVNQAHLSSVNDIFNHISEGGYSNWMAGYGIRAMDGSRSGAYNFTCTGAYGMTSENFNFRNCFKAIRVQGMNVSKINRNTISANKGVELVACYPSMLMFSNKVLTYNRGIEMGFFPGTNTTLLFNNVKVEEEGAIGIQLNNLSGPANNPAAFKIRKNNVLLKKTGTKGIDANGNNGIAILENTIESETAQLGFTGIRINNDQKSYFLCNKVIATTNAQPSTIGLDIWDAESTKYNCNELTKTAMGAAFRMGGFSPENFAETSFSNNGLGLFIDASAAIGTQTHRGNKWGGTFGSFGAMHGGSTQNEWNSSLFTVHTNTPPYRPTLPPGQGGWFAPDLGGSPSQVCPVCVPPTTPPPCCDEQLVPNPDGEIANGTFTTGTYNNEIGKLARRYLYRKLAEHPNLITQGGSTYSNFYNAQSATNIGAFHSVDDGIEGLYSMNPATEAQLVSNFEGIGQKMEKLAQVDSTILVDGSNANLVQQRQMAVQTINSLTNDNITLMQPVMAQRITNADQVETQNNNISVLSTDILDWNQKEVNRIYLNSVAIGEFSFSGSDRTTLMNIAQQCPLTGGSAVFKARGLLSVVSDMDFDDAVLCQPMGQRQGEGNNGIAKTVYQIFPNPANDLLTIVLPENQQLPEPTTIIVYNAFGLKVMEKRMSMGSPTSTIDVSTLPEGPILVSLLIGDKLIGSEKILLIH